ncbi:hypothetical protein [Reyranella soli]|uniref:hypothetical protein n=1 Tax=Reyranella soli TaxID=1230389 RepID=UPI0011BFB9CA|nr:hypothetical protein [Reyranella soli]
MFEGGDTGVEGEETVGGGGVAPGYMVSGMRPPLPIEPGGSCASTGVATITAAKARMKVVCMHCMQWDLLIELCPGEARCHAMWQPAEHRVR